VALLLLIKEINVRSGQSGKKAKRMPADREKTEDRVRFERGVDVYIMAIDGTWRRSCVMNDASPTGASLTTNKSIEGLNLKEFFLLLSTTGLAYRRCELASVNGDRLKVSFLLPRTKTRSPVKDAEER
jgi:hypothetical protein